MPDPLDDLIRAFGVPPEILEPAESVTFAAARDAQRSFIPRVIGVSTPPGTDWMLETRWLVEPKRPRIPKNASKHKIFRLNRRYERQLARKRRESEQWLGEFINRELERIMVYGR